MDATVLAGILVAVGVWIVWSAHLSKRWLNAAIRLGVGWLMGEERWSRRQKQLGTWIDSASSVSAWIQRIAGLLFVAGGIAALIERYFT